MKQPHIGRRSDAGRWPWRTPVGTFGAFFLALATVYGVGQYRYHCIWTPLQQAYLKPYLQSSTKAAITAKPTRYPVLMVRHPKGSWHATDGDVGTGARLEWTFETWPPAEFADALRTSIYRGEKLTDLASRPLLAGLFVLFVGLVFGVRKDIRRWRQRREGKRLQGSQLVDVPTFNKRFSGPSVPLWLQTGRTLHVPLSHLKNHALIGGDTATGKSTAIRHLLAECERNGDTVIVVDQECEYAGQFYRPERGDVILNPLDARCPYWTPASEIRTEAEAMAVAEALFPDKEHESNPFFTETSRQIFAYLLTLPSDFDRSRPVSPQEMAYWLSHADVIDKKIAGTSMAFDIHPKAPPQRFGVLSSLNKIGKTLKMLPRFEDAPGPWSAEVWAKYRKGWIFVTSGPETQASQLPLMTLWLDLLILRLMTTRQGFTQRTFVVIDELASLKRLPQLPEALRRIRKANVSMILGFQSKADVEDIYGKAALSMVSQSAVKMFFKTSEPETAEWVADTLGKVEIERITARREEGIVKRGDAHYDLHREQEHVVMQAVIQNLPYLDGFVKCEGSVVPVDLAYLDRPDIAERFIERTPGTAFEPLEPEILTVPDDTPQFIQV